MPQKTESTFEEKVALEQVLNGLGFDARPDESQAARILRALIKMDDLLKLAREN